MSFYFSDSHRKQQSVAGRSLLLAVIAAVAFLCFAGAFQLGRREAELGRMPTVAPGCATHPFPHPAA